MRKTDGYAFVVTRSIDMSSYVVWYIYKVPHK